SWALPILTNQAKREGNKGLSRRLQAGWCLCTLFILVNAIGYTAYHRTENVGERLGTIEGYEQAKSLLPVYVETLEKMKANERWDSTQGCTNATVPKSVEYCNEFETQRQKVAEVREILKKKRPNSGDPQAETLAFAFGYHIRSEVIAKSMPIFTAVVLDLATVLFFYAALVPSSPSKKPESAPKGHPQQRPKKRRGRPKGAKDKKPRKRRGKGNQKKGHLHSLPPNMANAFKLDGRKARGYRSRAANDSSKKKN
ncbi:MAG: hypothetical protein ACOCTM_04580, partial [Bacteroidota bacterium]